MNLPSDGTIGFTPTVEFPPDESEFNKNKKILELMGAYYLSHYQVTKSMKVCPVCYHQKGTCDHTKGTITLTVAIKDNYK